MPERFRAWTAAAAGYFEYRMLLILLLGFSCGLPLLLVFSTLSAWLRVDGISLQVIGWFSLASGAYALKFLWAPAVDRMPIPLLTRLLGQRRSWLLVAQFAMIAAALALGAPDPAENLALTALFAVILAFASATQDIVVDAYRIEILDDSRMGIGVANYVVGYRAATVVSGAGALIVADSFGWFAAYAVMAALMGVGIFATMASKEPARPPRPTGESLGKLITETVVMPFLEFTHRRHWLTILLFVALYKYGDALLGVMANPFYLDLGFSMTEIGLVTKGFGLAMTLLGGIVGGVLVARLGTMQALLIGGILQAVSNGAFALQAWIGPQLWMLFVTIGVDNLMGGIGTIAFLAYLSGLCNVAYTATQYALLSSVMAFARTFFAGGGGWVAERVDWVAYFLLTGIAAAPGLLLLVWLMRRLPAPAAPVAPH